VRGTAVYPGGDARRICGGICVVQLMSRMQEREQGRKESIPGHAVESPFLVT